MKTKKILKQIYWKVNGELLDFLNRRDRWSLYQLATEEINNAKLNLIATMPFGGVDQLACVTDQYCNYRLVAVLTLPFDGDFLKIAEMKRSLKELIEENYSDAAQTKLEEINFQIDELVQTCKKYLIDMKTDNEPNKEEDIINMYANFLAARILKILYYNDEPRTELQMRHQWMQFVEGVTCLQDIFYTKDSFYCRGWQNINKIVLERIESTSPEFVDKVLGGNLYNLLRL